MSSLALVAITHDNAPFDLLERVALDAESSSALAARLVATPGVDEAVVLSTCNRTELYLAGTTPDPAAARLALAAHTGMRPGTLAGAALVATDDDASLHLFRVACGLESRIVGEGEILGQVRSAATRAAADGTAGRHLTALFRFAAAAGRRVRRSGGLSARPSLASLALDSAGDSLTGGTVLVVGAGQLGSAIVAEVRARHLDYLVCARRPESASGLGSNPYQIVGLDRLVEGLVRADVVLCATSARTPLLRVEDVAAAMARRGGRPLTIVDLSVPRNVDPSAASLADVRVIDLDRITAEPGALQHRRASQAAATEHERYRTWLAGRAAAPAIVSLRSRVEQKCLVAARRSESCADPATVERLARRIAAQVLHGPTVALKGLVARGDVDGALALLGDYGVEASAETLGLPGVVTDWAKAS